MLNNLRRVIYQNWFLLKFNWLIKNTSVHPFYRFERCQGTAELPCSPNLGRQKSSWKFIVSVDDTKWVGQHLNWILSRSFLNETKRNQISIFNNVQYKTDILTKWSFQINGQVMMSSASNLGTWPTMSFLLISTIKSAKRKPPVGR